MSFLNPLTDKVQLDISDEFFPTKMTERYNSFLFHKNLVIKDIKGLILESVQDFGIPGINLSTVAVNYLNNSRVFGKGPGGGLTVPTSTNRIFPGTENQNTIFENPTFQINLRNNILNWMYFFEYLNRYYKRNRDVDFFYITITVMDAAEVPMMQFLIKDCFISATPGLEFNHNIGFNESKVINFGITFNELSVKFIIPGFELEPLILWQS